jgi:hypothetical protein
MTPLLTRAIDQMCGVFRATYGQRSVLNAGARFSSEVVTSASEGSAAYRRLAAPKAMRDRNKSGRDADSSHIDEPHSGQNWRPIGLPLSAVAVNVFSAP